MPPAPKDCQAPCLVTGARALAIAAAITLAGCQSNAPQPIEQPPASKASVRTFEPVDQWLTEPEETAGHEDIWERIRAGFQLQDQWESNPRIDQHRLLMASRANSIEIVSERSAPYIHYIVERLEEQQMPLELALLPVIESSYNPFAYSRAHAVGLWQFIPSTGLHFNLRQTNWYDGRRDITASTGAAIRYLNYLHGLFNGDWLLALAAYNAGEGTVSRAIERNQRRGLPTDYWNLDLPRETRDYVPKLLALSQLVMAPEDYGINLSPVANEPYFEIVSLEHRLDLARVAKMAELDEEELYRLNPAFTRRIALDGPKQLLVPAAKAELLEANLALMKGNDLVEWQQYRVRPGDSLGSIANRYQLTVNTLKDINKLSSNQLRAGQLLSIPTSATATGGAQPQVLHAVSRQAPAKTYRVKSGDNLWDIAKAHQVTVADLRRWNKLSGNTLKAGQTLSLQGAGASAPSKTQQTATYYKVQKGDSLYQIARRFNVQLANLKLWNPDSQVLKPGQMLTLYLPR